MWGISWQAICSSSSDSTPGFGGKKKKKNLGARVEVKRGGKGERRGLDEERREK